MRKCNANDHSQTGTASYFKTLRQLNQTEIEYNDDWYRKRLQSLQSVDELIDAIISRLSASPSVLNNTYLIYTTDNGYHIGQHRLPHGVQHQRGFRPEQDRHAAHEVLVQPHPSRQEGAVRGCHPLPSSSPSPGRQPPGGMRPGAT